MYLLNSFHDDIKNINDDRDEIGNSDEGTGNNENSGR